MTQQELRIGNLVWYRDKKIVEVSNLGNSFETISLHNRLPYGSDDIEEYNPVKLTEDWLLKFGFKFIDLHYGFLSTKDNKENSIRLRIENGKYLFSMNNFWSINIESVHKLQNFYYILTGEELKTIEL